MFGLFKRKKENQPALPPLKDLNKQPLKEGDEVNALRYDLGRCRVVVEESTVWYESLETGKRVSWHLMVDASTECQKVLKI